MTFERFTALCAPLASEWNNGERDKRKWRAVLCACAMCIDDGSVDTQTVYNLLNKRSADTDINAIIFC